MSSKSPRAGFGLCLALFLLFAGVGACSRGSNKCTATLTYEGKTYTGIGKEYEALGFACGKYCIADDSEYEAMYRIWLDSAEGRAAGRPSKGEAIYKSKRLLDFVNTTCANRCVGWTTSGRAQAEKKCD